MNPLPSIQYYNTRLPLSFCFVLLLDWWFSNLYKNIEYFIQF